jgi:hypothetical protein
MGLVIPWPFTIRRRIFTYVLPKISADCSERKGASQLPSKSARFSIALADVFPAASFPRTPS